MSPDAKPSVHRMSLAELESRLGSPQAKAELVRALDASVRRAIAPLVRRRFGAAALAELDDAAQDVLVALLAHDARELRRWDPARGRSLSSFVSMIARRRVLRTWSRRTGDASAHPSGGCEVSDQGSQARSLSTRQELTCLLSQLERSMAPRDRALFRLLFVLEREPDEVARWLGMTRGAVNAWVYRFRQSARRHAAQRDGAVSGARLSSPRTRSECARLRRGGLTGRRSSATFGVGV